MLTIIALILGGALLGLIGIGLVLGYLAAGWIGALLGAIVGGLLHLRFAE